jgi:predicted RNase H-like HicB family nuclease
MQTITAVLEKGTDGYGVSFEELPNVFGFGESLESAKQDAKDALTGFVQTLKKYNKPIPQALQGDYELTFEFDTSAILDYVGSVVSQTALAKAANEMRNA